MARHEWGKYMQEIYLRKFQELSHYSAANSAVDPSMDLMGAMIKSSGLLPNDANKNPANGLNESEIIGNSFVFMLAGHETAANTITHSLYYLAMHPSAQRKVQKELDDIFGGRDVSEWDYDRDLTPLFGGMIGAVMNETLRLIPPVVIIPKSTFDAGDQKVKLESGKEVVIPGETYFGLVDAGAHRNPKYWPHGPARSAADGGPVHPFSNTDNDIEEFKPERWLLDPSAKPVEDAVDEAMQKEADAVGVNTAPDTAATLFRPPKGAYLPFSEGFRSCIGRRFAQVEIMASLAVILQNYSVELAMDEWASDEEVERMTESQKKDLFVKARTAAETLMNDAMGTIITLQLRNGKIPVRLVKRGSEKFDF